MILIPRFQICQLSSYGDCRPFPPQSATEPQRGEGGPLSEQLIALIEKARRYGMTADERTEQEIGFAHGNAHYPLDPALPDQVQGRSPSAAAAPGSCFPLSAAGRNLRALGRTEETALWFEMGHSRGLAGGSRLDPSPARLRRSDG